MGGLSLRIAKSRYIFLFCVLGALVITAYVGARSYMADYSGYIEVCANGPTYVPPDVKFVKCFGVVRKVKGFSQMMIQSDEIDCKCPKCCNEECYIIVYSDPEPSGNPALLDDEASHACDPDGMEGIYYLWIAC